MKNNTPLAPSHSGLDDNYMTYHGHVAPENLVVWATTAMKNSYVPYSKRKEGVLIRTNHGDIKCGAKVETINWDEVTAIEIAIGSLLVQQPWIDAHHRPEKIRDVVYVLEDFNPKDPDTYVPDGRSLDWLRRFGSPDTKLYFANPNSKILATKTLHEVLPHGPKMKPLKDYFEKCVGFRDFLKSTQNHPEAVDPIIWDQLRRARHYAFAPYSGYRVGVVIEANDNPIPDDIMAEMKRGFKHAGISKAVQQSLIDNHLQRRQIFTGMNLELSGNTALHAEACAIGAMITELGPKAKLKNLFLQGGFQKGAEDCTCCGKCRQLVNEFSTAKAKVFTVAEDRPLPTMRAKRMLPGTFAKLG